MWHLTGDDIQRAKEELKGRRAAIKAHYDSEMKQLEADITAIETFERAAVDFVSNFKGENELAETVADPAPAAEQVVATIVEQSSPTNGETPAEQGTEAAAAPKPPTKEPTAAEKGSSRWRMRLNTPEGSR